MADNPPNIGELAHPDEHRRDAIHVAVLPVIAGTDLKPAQDVGLHDGSREVASPNTTNFLGIVDPFLPHNVKAGERFWLFLYPGTVTGMRHVWSHPMLTATTPKERT